MSDIDRIWKGFVMTLSDGEREDIASSMAGMRRRSAAQQDRVTVEYLVFVNTCGGVVAELPEGVTWT